MIGREFLRGLNIQLEPHRAGMGVEFESTDRRRRKKSKVIKNVSTGKRTSDVVKITYQSDVELIPPTLTEQGTGKVVELTKEKSVPREPAQRPVRGHWNPSAPVIDDD